MRLQWRVMWLAGALRQAAAVPAEDLKTGRDFDEFMNRAEERLGRPLTLLVRDAEVVVFRKDEET